VDDVADVVLRLVEDPSTLCAELDRCGRTLLHVDLRDEHLGFTDDGRVVLIDWGAAALGHPVVDLAWYMVHDVWRIDAGHDEVVADFHQARGERDDARALDLLGITGLVMYGWIFGHSAVVHTDPAERAWAHAELNWWVPRARRGLERWSRT
jgi:aminoglycoside phosphotransferase (APT) family kinase protein